VVNRHRLHTLTVSSDEQIERVSLAMCWRINMLQKTVSDQDVGQFTVDVDIDIADNDERLRVRSQPLE